MPARGRFKAGLRSPVAPEALAPRSPSCSSEASMSNDDSVEDELPASSLSAAAAWLRHGEDRRREEGGGGVGDSTRAPGPPKDSSESGRRKTAAGEVGGETAALDSQKSSRRHRRCWACVDAWDVSTFTEEVPKPALDFAFELDTFQKRAVRRVHREEHVLVAAHTSAGKTVVAEYAIADAMGRGMRAVYTSPIKALSNQKFREFTRRFDGIGSVGIVTGDVAVNPDASCVIMTTEILRSMLYRGDQELDNVKWVIFDEVHYVNDPDRGVVWEEVIILLPPKVSIVMLSATVPNYHEFADWVGRTKRKAVYTVHTSHRPTPLRHFLHFSGKSMPLLEPDSAGLRPEAFQEAQEMYKDRFKPPPRKVRQVSVKFETRPFGMTPTKVDSGDAASCYVVEKVNHNDPSKPAWKLGVRPGWVLVRVAGRDVRRLPLEQIQQITKEIQLPASLDFEVPPKDKDKDEKPQQPPQPKPQTWESRERAETQRLQRLLRELEAEALLPATVFVFSRRRVEALAAQMSNIDVCTTEDKSKIHIFLKACFERLTDADRQLPQVRFAAELARRGVGIHHSGLLPLVKEAVEILFSRGLVKILLATETFAMGVNMPARSVIFTDWHKHDGVQRRALLPGEYTQMAGRAGRRGLDDEGRVYLLCKEQPPDYAEVSRMMTHMAERLNSRFRVTFAMVLQLRRFSSSGVSVEDVLGRSFLENGRALRRPVVRRDLSRRKEELEALPVVRCTLSCGGDDEAAPMDEYEELEAEARELGAQLHEQLWADKRCRQKVFCPGRVLRAYKPGAFFTSPAVVLGLESSGEGHIQVAALIDDGEELVSSVMAADSAKGASRGGEGGRCDANTGGSGGSGGVGGGRRVVVACLTVGCVVQLFEQCLDAQTCRQVLASGPDVDSSVPAESIGALADLGRELLGLLMAAAAGAAAEAAEGHLEGAGAGASSSGLQPLMLSKALRQVDSDAYSAFLRQQELQVLQESSPCQGCHLRYQHFVQAQCRNAVVKDIEDLGRELGDRSLGLLPQLHARERVLQAQGCLNQEGLITLKGRAATEVLSGDEITIIEVVTSNSLSGFTSQEVAAAVSAFVFPDKVEEQAEEVLLPERLSRLRDRVLKHHHDMDGLLRRHGVDIDPDEFARSCNVGLMGIMYRWACGEPLANIMPDTWLQEGTIVRAIVRAEELLRKLQDVAKLLGNDDLRQVFKEASEIIHRDIAFVPSLYLE